MSGGGIDREHAYPVLVYHSVAEAAPAAVGRWNVTPAQLAAHAELVAATQRPTLTVSELAERLGSTPEGDLPITITFDDGFANTLPAVRSLDSLGIRSTVYITTSFLNRPGMLSDEDVRELAAIPSVELGSHGVTHQRLDELPRSEIGRELSESRVRLETLAGRPITTCAYPRGAYDRRVRREVVAQGYGSAAAVKGAFSHPGDDRYSIARWLLESDTATDDVARVLDGEMLDPARPGNGGPRTVGDRLVRRARRRLNRPR